MQMVEVLMEAFGGGEWWRHSVEALVMASGRGMRWRDAVYNRRLVVYEYPTCDY